MHRQVGATEIDKDREDVRATFSNFGPCVDVWAPGRNIVSSATTSNTSYVKKSGTSMAAPFVAGEALFHTPNDDCHIGRRRGTVSTEPS